VEGEALKILTELQEEVLSALFSVDEVRRHFYLTGGTALSAFYLRHRLSDDLDLFTHSVAPEDVDREIEAALAGGGRGIERVRQAPGFRSYRVGGELKVDVVKDTDFRVGSPELLNAIMVDSKKNIAVNKVLAIYGRLDPKDYVDLFFLLKDGEYDILKLLELGKKKDAGLDNFMWAKVVADAEGISVLPRMVVPFDLDEMKAFYRETRGRVVDSVKPGGCG